MRNPGMKSFNVLIASTLALVAGCAPAVQQTQSQEAILRVDSDRGAPLADVAVSHDGKIITHTGTDGGARLRMTGYEGDIFHVGVACPAGYEPATALEFDVVVHRAEGPRLPEFAVRCTKTVRRTVVSVRAVNGPNLPVLHLGREVARTDANGAATIPLDVQPGTDVELVLDTRSVKRIHPASPTLSFKATNRDEPVVLDQTFTIERPRVVRVVRRAPAVARRLGGD
jgi:hypothetical protein